MENNQPVRVRFAPSPTGRTHLGSGRTALYNYLLARQTGGTFILRIEDTDQKRYVPEAEQELVHSLRWLGLSWDEGPDVGGPNGPYRQSERKDIYRQYAEQLISLDRAYYCFCSTERLAEMRKGQQARKEPLVYDGTCRHLSVAEVQRRVKAGEPHVVRFKTPRQGSITVRDLLRGEITVENRFLDDFILVKSDGLALYHLAAMVDDHLMGITHVIRGSEWLSTFPLHGHIIRAFGWTEPVFVHLSVFLKPSGKGKMSKRESAQLIQDGHSVFLTDLEQLGYIPEGVANWIALMGWSYDDHTEYFRLLDLVEKFSLQKGIGLLLGISGAALIVSGRQNNATPGANMLLGDILVIINAISYSFYFVLVKPLMENYHPIHVVRWVFTFGAFLILPFGIGDFLETDFSRFTLSAWLALALVVLGTTFLAYILNVFGIKYLGAGITGMYIYTQPLFASVLGIVLLGEGFSFRLTIAAGLIAIGVLLVTRKRS